MAANGEEKQSNEQPSQEIKHQEVGHKSLLQSDALYQVCIVLKFNLDFSQSNCL